MSSRTAAKGKSGFEGKEKRGGEDGISLGLPSE
jgi:hypothetical protein